MKKLNQLFDEIINPSDYITNQNLNEFNNKEKEENKVEAKFENISSKKHKKYSFFSYILLKNNYAIKIEFFYINCKISEKYCGSKKMIIPKKLIIFEIIVYFYYIIFY